MYLLEAKKRAEKQAKKDAKKAAQEAKKAAIKDAKERKKNGGRSSAASMGVGGSSHAIGRTQSKHASEAQLALERAEDARRQEEADIQAALRASRDQAREEERRREEAQLRMLQERQQQQLKNRRTDEQQKVAARREGGKVSSGQLKPNLETQLVEVEGQWQDVQVPCTYVGTFEAGEGKIDKNMVKKGIHVMREYIDGSKPATMIICLEGIKVIDEQTKKVAMAHALTRISLSSADHDNALFGFVAKNPGTPKKFCHVFHMRKQKHVHEVQALVGKAFKVAFSKNTLKRSKERKAAGSSANLNGGSSANLAPAASSSGHSRSQSRDPSRAQSRDPSRAQSRDPSRASSPLPDSRKPKRQWARHNPLEGMGTPAQPQQASGNARPSLTRDPSAIPTGIRTAAEEVEEAEELEEMPQAIPKQLPEDVLDDAVWFQAGIPREIAIELLERSEEGAFIVRESQSQPGNYALTMKAQGQMHHYIIQKTPKGYVLGTDTNATFPQLYSLILNYSVNEGPLRCCLSLDALNPTEKEKEGGDAPASDSFVDPDYQSLQDVQATLMAMKFNS